MAMVCDGIQATSVVALHFPNRFRNGCFKGSPGRICDRTNYWLFCPKPSAPALANEITGNVKIPLLGLLIVWTFAALGEEIAYRGYLLTRAADEARRSKPAYWIGVVLVSILFGYGHYQKGASAVIDSGIAGLIVGSAYHAGGPQPSGLRPGSRIY